MRNCRLLKYFPRLSNLPGTFCLFRFSIAWMFLARKNAGPKIDMTIMLLIQSETRTGNVIRHVNNVSCQPRGVTRMCLRGCTTMPRNFDQSSERIVRAINTSCRWTLCGLGKQREWGKVVMFCLLKAWIELAFHFPFWEIIFLFLTLSACPFAGGRDGASNGVLGSVCGLVWIARGDTT